SQANARQPAQLPRAEQLGRAATNFVQIRGRGQASIVQVIENATLELERRALPRGHGNDAADARNFRERVVERVIRNAHATLNHGSGSKVQRRDLSPDLQRLLVRQPVATLPQTVVERDTDV